MAHVIDSAGVASDTFFAPITKMEETKDGTLIIWGKATGPDLDRDEQRMGVDWLKSAVPTWFETGANVREMHGLTAAGVGIELVEDGDDFWLKSECVDAETVKKFKKKVLTGYSIGISGGKIVKTADAPKGTFIDGWIPEISYVDRPCNPTCKTTILKAAGAGELAPVEQVFTELPQENPVDADKTETADEPKTDVQADLKEAIKAVGKEADHAATVALMTKISEKLGADKLAPEAIKTVAALVVKTATEDEWLHDPAELASIRDGLAHLMQAELDELMNGEHELWDLQDLLCTLQTFLCWWHKEASEGEAPAPAALADLIPDAEILAETDKTVIPEVVKTIEGEPKAVDEETIDEKIEKAVAAAVTKVLAGFADKDTVTIDEASTELVTKVQAATEARKVAEERIEALEAQVERLGAQPAPSSVVKTVVADTGAKAASTTTDLQLKHAEYLATTAQDPGDRAAYEDWARQLRAKAA
jgi:hypothetical protein